MLIVKWKIKYPWKEVCDFQIIYDLSLSYILAVVSNDWWLTVTNLYGRTVAKHCAKHFPCIISFYPYDNIMRKAHCPWQPPVCFQRGLMTCSGRILAELGLPLWLKSSLSWSIHCAVSWGLLAQAEHSGLVLSLEFTKSAVTSQPTMRMPWSPMGRTDLSFVQCRHGRFWCAHP